MTLDEINIIKYALMYDAEHYQDLNEEVIKLCGKPLTRNSINMEDFKVCGHDKLATFWLDLIQTNENAKIAVENRWELYLQDTGQKPRKGVPARTKPVPEVTPVTPVTPETPINTQEPTKQSSPGLLQMAKNLTTAVVKDVKAGRPRRSKEDTDKILDICKSCPHYLADSQRCNLCGCFLPIKAAWAQEKCPDKKW